MDTNSAESAAALEPKLADWERRTGELERQIKRLAAAARRLHRVAREGDLAAAAAAVAATVEARRQAADAVEAATRVPAYDIAAAFAAGEYLRELAAAATAAGLTLVERDGAISSYPVSLRLDAARAGVRVGRRLERRVRPKFLAEQLRKLQQAPTRFNARAFATRLFRAYELHARAAQHGWRATTPGAGPAVPLRDIFDTPSLASGSDYQVEEFATDLLRLDREPDTLAGTGHRFRFAAATALKGARYLTVYDEDGGRHDYFAILFVLEPSDGRSENAPSAA
jgi:hypothetical protein